MPSNRKENMIILDESLSYIDFNGANVNISSKFGLAILAVIASLPEQRCPREKLKNLLWPNSVHPYSSNCLRQAVFKLRGELNQAQDVLFSDSKSVWLEDVHVQTSAPTNNLLTALPFIHEQFNGWLEAFRENRRGEVAPTQTVSKPVSCPIYLYLGEAIPPSPSHDAVINLATDRFALNVQWNGVLELYDYRQSLLMQSEQSLSDNVGLAVHFKLIVTGGESQLTATAVNTLTRQIVWTESLAGDDSSTLTMSSERISVFIANTVDSLESFVTTCRTHHLSEERLQLAEAITMLSSLQSDKVLIAIEKLESMHYESQPLIQAWLGFAYMLLSGESMVKDRLSAQLMAKDYILSALSKAPRHPFVLAVAGHYYTFYQRDFQYADELLNKAMSIAPHMALVRDARGLLCLYNDDFKGANQHIQYAVTLSSASPLSNYITASKVMLLTSIGQHEHSVNLAERILHQSPNFDAVKRYAFCSLAQVGELSKAELLYQQVTSSDPGLLEKAVHSIHTPLVSENFHKLFKKSAKIFT